MPGSRENSDFASSAFFPAGGTSHRPDSPGRAPLTCAQGPGQEEEQETEPPGLRPGDPHPERETWGGRGRVTVPDPRPAPSSPSSTRLSHRAAPAGAGSGFRPGPSQQRPTPR